MDDLNVVYTLIHNHQGTNTSGTGCYTTVASSTAVYGVHTAASHASDAKVYCKYCGTHMGDPAWDRDHWYTDWNDKSGSPCSSNFQGYSYTYSLSCGKTEGQTWETDNVSNLDSGDSIASVTIIY